MDTRESAIQDAMEIFGLSLQAATEMYDETVSWFDYSDD